MSDDTEETRRLMVKVINVAPSGREELEEAHGQVWDTKQLQEDFEVRGFLAPFIGVTQKATGKEGALTFQHAPRYYWGFRETSS